MSGLLERLEEENAHNSWCVFVDGHLPFPCNCDAPDLLREAAAEIRRLRAGVEPGAGTLKTHRRRDKRRRALARLREDNARLRSPDVFLSRVGVYVVLYALRFSSELRWAEDTLWHFVHFLDGEVSNKVSSTEPEKEST